MLNGPPTLPKPSVFVYYTVSREFRKKTRYLNDLSQLLYNVVCRSRGCLFCKKKKKKRRYFYLSTFYAVVSVQTLYCSVHVVTLAL